MAHNKIVRDCSKSTLQVFSIKDWDEYFGSTKEKLEKEMEELRKEIG